MKRRADVIVSMKNTKNHIVGNTQRHNVNYAGPFGIETVSRVSFDMNTAKKLIVTIDDKKYGFVLPDRKHETLMSAIKLVCRMQDSELEEYELVK